MAKTPGDNPSHASENPPVNEIMQRYCPPTQQPATISCPLTKIAKFGDYGGTKNGLYDKMQPEKQTDTQRKIDRPTEKQTLVS